MTKQTKHSLLEEELALCQAELERTRATLAREKEARREAKTILDERTKELNCLYDLSKLGERPDLSLPELLRAIVYRLPVAWQYPEIAGARLTYRGETYHTPNFAETPWQQRSPLMHQERRVGELTICYTEERPREAIGPFLAEEQELLEAVAEYIERIIERRETTSQLQASEARFRRAVLEAPFPMMIHAEDGRVLQINNVWTELTGYTHEEIPTISDWTEKAYGERQEVVKVHIDQLYDQDARIPEGKYEITTKGGEQRVWEFNSAPLGLTSDGRRQVISIAMDVTERKRAKKALRQERDRAQQYLDIAGVIFIALDAQGNVTLVNQKGSEVLGYEQQAIIGRNWFDRFIPARIREEIRGVFEMLMAGEVEPVEYYESYVVTQAGEERIVSWHNTVLRNEGQIAGILGSGEDITERKRAEAALRRYKLAVESSNDSIIIIAPDYTYVLANENYLRYHQLRRDEVIGHSVEKVVGEEIFQTAQPYLKRCFAGEQTRYEITYPYPGMGERTLMVNYSPLRDNGSGIIGVVGVLHDITERKRAESQLHEALMKTRRRENETRWLLSASQAILASRTFEAAARQIFDAACEVTGAISGYVALLSEEGAENELVFLEAGGLPCDVDPELPMPIRGLRAEAYHKGEVVYDNDFMSSEWMKFMPGGHVELRNVLFAPLTIDNQVVGVIGLANKPTDFTEDDAKIACAFGDLAAIALDSVRKESALRESERRFRLIAEHAQDLIYRIRLHPDRQFEYVSPSATKITGYTPEEHYADPELGYKLVHPDDRAKLQQAAQAPSDEPLVLRWVRKDGRVIWMEQQNTPIYDDAGRMTALEGIARDITARKETALALAKQTRALRRVNRALRVLSECNQILVRAEDEARLMNDICQALVDFGDYRLAWVGYAIETKDGARVVEPAAWAAVEKCLETYVDGLRIRWDESELGRGPTGRAIRTGEFQIVRNMKTNHSYSPWRSAATSQGFASSIALPLIIEGEAGGALNLYANDVNAFDPEEIRLLIELASDLSYGIQALRTHEDRERVEDELRAMYETINHSPVIAFRWTPTHPWTILYVSKNIRQFGYTPEDFYSDRVTYADFIHPADRERIMADVERHIQHDAQQFAQEYRVRTRKGETRWVDDRTWVHRDADGEIIGFHGIILDITERHQMAQQLQKYTESLEEQVAEKVRELEKAQIKMVQTAKLASLGEMATGVAHELNQPLTSMLFDADYLKSWAQQAQREDDDRCPVDFGEIYQLGEDFISDIDRCRRITDYLRSFRRLTRGEPVHFDLNQAIEGSLTLARARLIQHGVEFQSDLTPNLPPIYAHPGQIEHVFLNLIHNAERALAEMARRIEAGEVQRPDYQKRLTIATRLGDEGEHVIAAVHDNGCGIPPEAQAELFRPFFTTKAFGEGTGLGLTISHSIVQEFNGEIAVESTENEGTTFILRFPIVDEG